MKTKKTITITLQKEDKEFLRLLAAEENIKDTDAVVTAAMIAKEVIEDYLTQKRNERSNNHV